MKTNRVNGEGWKVFLSSIVLLMTCAGASAADLDVNARAIPSRVTLGQEFRLVIRVTHPRTVEVMTPAVASLLGPFEVRSVERSARSAGTNRPTDTFTVRLASFGLGTLTVPPVEIRGKTEAGRALSAMTPPVAVAVVSVGKKPTDKDDIRPIKGPARTSLGPIRDAAAGVLAAILALWLGVRLWLRRRARSRPDPESLLPPHERALRELLRLREKSWPAQGKYREHYSELSDILRRTLERRYGLSALDWTTPETASRLKEHAGVSRTEIARRVLEAADLVKFARYVPSAAETAETEKRLVEFVELTKPEPEEAMPAGRPPAGRAGTGGRR